MDLMTILEMLSYAVTVVGLPLAIFVFLFEQRKERENEEEEIYQRLSDGYTDFLRLALDNPDLKLQSREATKGLSEEQSERMLAMFGILISLFERAYMVGYEHEMSERKLRRWRSWDDFMREWCRREDFRNALPQLLQGEDPEFVAYISDLAAGEAASVGATVSGAST